MYDKHHSLNAVPSRPRRAFPLNPCPAAKLKAQPIHSPSTLVKKAGSMAERSNWLGITVLPFDGQVTSIHLSSDRSQIIRPWTLEAPVHLLERISQSLHGLIWAHRNRSSKGQWGVSTCCWYRRGRYWSTVCNASFVFRSPSKTEPVTPCEMLKDGFLNVSKYIISYREILQSGLSLSLI